MSGQNEISSSELELTRYDEIMVDVFFKHYRPGLSYLRFTKDELAEASEKRGYTIRNVPDIIYTYRVRRLLPEKIVALGHWAIEPCGRGQYAFRLLRNPPRFEIRFGDYEPVAILNAIPEVVEGLLRRDEQSLLTRVLYNRLVDIFTGLTCYHIENHYRSFVKDSGEVEVDAIYVGIDRKGTLHILPIEAKSQQDSEMIGRVQVSHMAKLARQDFSSMRRRVLAIKDLPDGTIAVVEFNDEDDPDEIRIVSIARFNLTKRSESLPIQPPMTPER
ncbi:MAG: hypothetical protein HPY55_09130 [Firmicutes bacterium]|nr:hypothetical protein [Bacillota bacterium]